jgi:hypothetical protein
MIHNLGFIVEDHVIVQSLDLFDINAAFHEISFSTPLKHEYLVNTFQEMGLIDAPVALFLY